MIDEIIEERKKWLATFAEIYPDCWIERRPINNLKRSLWKTQIPLDSDPETDAEYGSPFGAVLIGAMRGKVFGGDMELKHVEFETGAGQWLDEIEYSSEIYPNMRSAYRSFFSEEMLNGSTPGRLRLHSKGASSGLRYFHGGVPGLQVGDSIIPRNQTPSWNGQQVTWQGISASQLGDSGDTVSITTDIHIAKSYAGQYLPPGAKNSEPGQVYEVVPLGDPVDDPDYYGMYPQIARCALGAKIVAVFEQVQPLPISEMIELQKHTFFYSPDGSWVYDPDGYVNLTQYLVNLGHSRQSLIDLGQWPDPSTFGQRSE